MSDFLSDDAILACWRAGQDTRDIAIRYMTHESYIASRLPSILQRSRQDQEWNFDRTAELRA